jgi:hypothetical protein
MRKQKITTSLILTNNGLERTCRHYITKIINIININIALCPKQVGVGYRWNPKETRNMETRKETESARDRKKSRFKSDNFAKSGAHRKPCNLNSLLYLTKVIRIWDRTNISLIDDNIFLHVILPKNLNQKWRTYDARSLQFKKSKC